MYNIWYHFYSWPPPPGYTLALKDLDGFENAVGMADLYDLKVVKPLVAPVDQYVSEGLMGGNLKTWIWPLTA